MRHGILWLTPWVTVADWVSASSGKAIGQEQGSSLVQVGPDHGILVTSQGRTAVRSDVLPKQPALRAAMQAAQARKSARSAACPSGSPSSLLSGCRDWCGQVVAGSNARTKGSCSDSMQCFCEVEAGVMASCRMTCEVSSAGKAVTTTTTQAAPGAPRRQLLYDTRIFTDFLTQVEVFFVALELVKRLNALVKEKCGDATGEGCQPWSLVLPPWCFVPKWYGEPSNVTRWQALFDMKKLAGEVPVEEFAQQRVDLGVIPVTRGSRQLPKLKDGSGDFLGFTKDMQVCNSNGQQAPEAGSTRGSVVYAGYCPSDVSVSSLKCGVLDLGFKALVDLVASAGKRSNSVLLKHLDAMQLQRLDGVGALNIPALVPAVHLQQSAQRFRESPVTLGSLPYLAIHLDTHDITQKDLAPSAAAAAARINRVLKKKKLEQVFVAGAFREGFQSELRLLVKEALYFSQDDGADRLEHRGAEELVEVLLCSKAEYFIGSSSKSVFSATVRRQRQHAGLPSKSSEEVFCASLQVADAPKRCTFEQ